MCFQWWMKAASVAVLCAALCIRGPRPRRPGLRRYYADESICFTRLVFMTESHPLAAPPEGWGLLAGIPVRAGEPCPSDARVLERVRRDVARARVLPPGCTVEGARLMVADPACVVFTRETREAAAACRAHLARGGIAALGRYGRWEYGSIAHAMGQGRGWARAVDAAAAAVAG